MVGPGQHLASLRHWLECLKPSGRLLKDIWQKF